MTDVKPTEEATRSVGMERAEGQRNALQVAVETLTLSVLSAELPPVDDQVSVSVGDLRLVLSSLVEAREALQPFAAFAENVDAVGWTSSIHREPISYWFGPSDFRQALRSMEGKNV